jgi:hypothetical protein
MNFLTLCSLSFILISSHAEEAVSGVVAKP